MKRFNGQGKHLFALLVLLGPVVWFDRQPGALDGDWLSIPTRAWFWLAVAVPILHQFGVMVLWRLELFDRAMTKRFGDRAFTVFQSFFFPGLIARPISVLALTLADRNSLQGSTWILDVLAIIMVPILIYLFTSIHRYFGIARAAGADHFFEEYRTQPLVKDGIYRHIPNAMYVVGFLIVWIPALLLASRAGLLVAAFQHIFIWAHYYFTEKPDMRFIYRDA
jgi:hypothetical protein